MILIAFMLGASAGSFLSALAYRTHKGMSVTAGRSLCPRCLHKLAWSDLVPLVSFVTLGGRCRYCLERISLRYPATELALGGLFVLPIFMGFSGAQVALLWGILFTLSFIFLYDALHYLILDKALAALAVFALVLRLAFWGDVPVAFLSALGTSLAFLLVFLVSRGRWMGFGDVKLAFVMGLVLSWPSVMAALAVGVSAGAAVGLWQVAYTPKTLKSEIPFGPFLVAGTITALFWGQALVDWYVGLVV